MNGYTRRGFIKKTVGTAGVFGFAVGCRHLATSGGKAEVGADDFELLRPKLKGWLILPADSGYEAARRVFYWNTKTERKPLAVVQCAHEDDAVRAVEFARRHGLEIAVRSGGHSHLGWGSSNGLVIDSPE